MSSTADQTAKTTSARKRLAETLKTARLNKRLTIKRLAKLLQIPESTLEALEDPDDTELSIAHVAGLAERVAPHVNLTKAKLTPLIADLYTPVKSPLTSRRAIELGGTFVVTRAGFGLLVSLALLLVGGYAFWQVRTLTSAPPLSLSAPASNLVQLDAALPVEGRSAPDSTVLVNGDPVPLGSDGKFSTTVYLQPGYNSLDVTAINSFSRRGRVQRVIYYQPPPVATTVD